jgi:hypothetical protein
MDMVSVLTVVNDPLLSQLAKFDHRCLLENDGMDTPEM